MAARNRGPTSFYLASSPHHVRMTERLKKRTYPRTPRIQGIRKRSCQSFPIPTSPSCRTNPCLPKQSRCLQDWASPKSNRCWKEPSHHHPQGKRLSQVLTVEMVLQRSHHHQQGKRLSQVLTVEMVLQASHLPEQCPR